MFLKNKKYLRDLKRVRIPEKRDLSCGLRLDRNEKVDDWPEDFMFKILESKPRSFFSTYPDMAILYTKLSEHLNVSEEQILISSGIDGVIKTLFETLIEPGGKVGVLSPTYAMYDVYARIFQAKIYHVGYNKDYSIDWGAFDKCLSERTKIFFLPNPNQPIESCLSLEELKVLSKKCLDAGCLLVIDEAYHYFGAESSLPLIEEFENVVIMRTFSKAFGIPSARLGYMVSTVENMELLSKTRFAHEANSVSAAMAEYLLDNFNIVENYVDNIKESKEYTKKELQSMGLEVRGDNGNYLLVKFATTQDAKDCANFLKERKIYIKGPWNVPWEKCVSITLAEKKIMNIFIDAMNDFYNIERE